MSELVMKNDPCLMWVLFSVISLGRRLPFPPALRITAKMHIAITIDYHASIHHYQNSTQPSLSYY